MAQSRVMAACQPGVAAHGGMHLAALQGSRVFQGGTYTDLHGMLGVRSGADVLYVGDHIYGDIVKSKKSLGWRTMLVIPELESELAKTEQATYDELKRCGTGAVLGQAGTGGSALCVLGCMSGGGGGSMHGTVLLGLHMRSARLRIGW